MFATSPLALVVLLGADPVDLKALDKTIAAETQRIIDASSRRGDALFFRGNFAAAVADYERMVSLNKSLDRSHWRLGIAYFYAGKHKQAAAQFGKYHSYDNVDRENGIWRYFSQYKAKGKKAARKELLKYEKDDREPFGDVYRLFSGKTTGAAILKKIAAAKIEKNEREKRLFYANLYIGLNDAIEGRSESAGKHLAASTANNWGRKAGFGPNYMWHVGRLHLALLKTRKPKTNTKQP